MNRRSLFKALFAGAHLAVGQARDKGDGVDAGLSPGHPADQAFAFATVTTCALCGFSIMNMAPSWFLSGAKNVMQCSNEKCANRVPWLQHGSFAIRRLTADEQTLLDQRRQVLYSGLMDRSPDSADKAKAREIALCNIDTILCAKLRSV